jgi:hypothetical protein
MNPGSGIYIVGGPPVLPILGGFPAAALGTCRTIDSSGNVQHATEVINNGNYGGTIMVTLASTQSTSMVSESYPWVWAVSDALIGHFTYPLS